MLLPKGMGYFPRMDKVNPVEPRVFAGSDFPYLLRSGVSLRGGLLNERLDPFRAGLFPRKEKAATAAFSLVGD